MNEERKSFCKCFKTVEVTSFEFGSCFADCIAEVSHAAYKSLPKTGKPQPGSEWTLLASIVQVVLLL